MKQRIVYINGELLSESEAKLSIYDTAIATGELIVEVTRTYNRIPFRLEEHLKRLFEGLAEFHIELEVSLEKMIKLTNETLQANLETEDNSTEWQIIHYISRGLTLEFGLFDNSEIRPTLIINCFPLKKRLAIIAHKYVTGVDLVVPAQRVIPAKILCPQIKKGATGIMLDSDGYLAEGTGTSLFLVRGGKIYTSPSHRVLNGITRRLVFELVKKANVQIIEADLTVENAKQSEEIFITSTVISLLHARTFQKKLVGDGNLGSVTSLIRQAFIKEVGLDFAQQAINYASLIKNKERN